MENDLDTLNGRPSDYFLASNTFSRLIYSTNKEGNCGLRSYRRLAAICGMGQINESRIEMFGMIEHTFSLSVESDSRLNVGHIMLIFCVLFERYFIC